MTIIDDFLNGLSQDYPLTFEWHTNVLEREHVLTARNMEGEVLLDAVIGFSSLEDQTDFLQKIADFKFDVETMLGMKDNVYRLIAKEVEAVPYEEGMEDGILYDIAMFGLFTKEECLCSGFTPDFENDKLPYILTSAGKEFLNVGDWIIVSGNGERHVCKADDFENTYEKVIYDGC